MKFVPLEKFIIICPKCKSQNVTVDTYYGDVRMGIISHEVHWYILCKDCEYEYKPEYGHYIKEGISV